MIDMSNTACPVCGGAKWRVSAVCIDCAPGFMRLSMEGHSSLLAIAALKTERAKQGDMSAAIWAKAKEISRVTELTAKEAVYHMETVLKSGRGWDEILQADAEKIMWEMT